jgi:cobalt-zinc-cadmium efflux system membrane fusion protein
MGRFRCVVFVALAAAACSESGSSTGASHEAPASVEHPRTEAELSTIRLTPEAVKRLGIETVTVTTDTAPAARTVGGEMVVPEGRGVIVTAPVAGTLTGGAGPRPGARVRRGERLMTIAPLVPAERDQRIEAQRAVTSAEAEELAARQRLGRLEQLLKDGAASVRSVEEARAQHQVTQATLTAARERLKGASQNPVGAQGELVVSAAFDGIVQSISAVSGQTVAASAPLLELAQVDTLWIRVPVYAGEADAIDDSRPAAVRKLGGSDRPKAATRVIAPLQGDPQAAAVNLFYALSGSGGTFRPGERVLVELPLKAKEKGLIVPESAVLYDIHGATWVYQDLGNNAYARRRIEVARHAGGRIVVSRGMVEGAKVVTAGAAELFGTEFGAGH